MNIRNNFAQTLLKANQLFVCFILLFAFSKAGAQNVAGFAYTNYTSVNAGTWNYGGVSNPFTVTYSGDAWDTKQVPLISYLPIATPATLSNYSLPATQLELGAWVTGATPAGPSVALYNFTTTIPAGAVMFLQDVDASESFTIEFISASGLLLNPAAIGTYNLSNPAHSTVTFNATNIMVTATDAVNYTESLSDFVFSGSSVKQIRITQTASANTLGASGTAEFYFAAPPVSITGTVYNDTNGTTGGVNGTPMSGVTVVLFAANGSTVIATTTTDASGNYSFFVSQNTTYIIKISDPSGYQDISSTDATPTDGSTTVAVTTSNVTGVNFGIEQPPVAGGGTNTAVNPNGTTQVTLPANTFTNTAVSSDATLVTGIHIFAFPSGASSVVINGTSYTSATFPAAGIIVPTDANGNPTQTITVDPVSDDAVTVVVPFRAVDAAGAESGFAGSAVLNLTTSTPVNACASSELTASTAFVFTPTGSGVAVNTLNSNGWVGAGSGTIDVGSTDTYIHDNVNTQTFTHAFTAVNPSGAGAVLSMNVGIRNGIAGIPTINNWGKSSVLTMYYGGVAYATLTTDPTTGSDGHIATIAYLNGASGSLPNNYTFDYGPSPQSFGVMNLTNWLIYLPASVPNNGNVVIEFDPGGTSSGDAADDFDVAAVSLKACPLTITGSVFNDVDGMTDNLVDNNGGAQSAATLPAGLTANLFNSTTGAFVATVNVVNGTYVFPNVAQNTDYTVILSNVAATAGSTTANFVPALPAGWGNTGDIIPSGTATASTPGISASLTVGSTHTSGINFGIERLPESAFNQQPNVGNPGGFNSLTIPASAFQTNNVGATPNTQDYDGGTVTNIRITEFPAGANSITIGTTTYTNGGTCPPSATCTAWPAAGVTVPYTNGTGPTQAIKVDPIEGNIDVVVKFAAIDNAGKEDATPGSVTIPFKTVTVTGTVWNDADGSLAQNGSEAVINGTNTGGGVVTGQVLYANLIDASGIVIATVPVQNNGTYSFPNVPQSATGLTVQLSTNQGTVGIAKPATSLPAGWVTTGENKNGQAGTPDATPNGEIVINTATSAITQQNFGVERLPDTNPRTQSIGYPSGGVITAGKVSTAVSGTDAEDGTLGNGNKIVISSLPANATMFYNGAAVTPGQQISGFNPALVSFTGITNGSTSVVFNYAFIDAAGKQDPTPASYTVSWLVPLPVTLQSFSATKENDKVQLSWRTLTEQNVSRFVIEHSADGINFTAIATVAATGNSSMPVNYSWMHNNPVNGNNYYRLKMVDIDDRFTYSTVAVVKMNSNTDLVISVYPNPVHELLNIVLPKPGTAHTMLNVYSNDGKLLYSKATGNAQTILLPVSTFAKGVYYIRIMENGSALYNTKFVKQ